MRNKTLISSARIGWGFSEWKTRPRNKKKIEKENEVEKGRIERKEKAKGGSVPEGESWRPLMKELELLKWRNGTELEMKGENHGRKSVSVVFFIQEEFEADPLSTVIPPSPSLGFK